VNVPTLSISQNIGLCDSEAGGVDAGDNLAFESLLLIAERGAFEKVLFCGEEIVNGRILGFSMFFLVLFEAFPIAFLLGWALVTFRLWQCRRRGVMDDFDWRRSPHFNLTR
jgi:hypothetical protein